MKIAIIGSGISGNVAAHILSKSHDVTIYEKRDRAGEAQRHQRYRLYRQW